MAKRKPMRSRWKSIDCCDVDHEVPSVACCYVLYLEGELAYVGSTENLHTRMLAHFYPARYSDAYVNKWGRFRQLTVKYRASQKLGDWLMIEFRLIRRLCPKFNKRSVKRPKGLACAE